MARKRFFVFNTKNQRYVKDFEELQDAKDYIEGKLHLEIDVNVGDNEALKELGIYNAL